MRGKIEGMLVGFFSGLLFGVFFGNLVFYAIIYMYVGYVNGFFKRIYYPEDLRLPLILIASSDFLLNLVTYILFFLMRGRLNFGYYFFHIMIPALVYTVFITVFLYFVILHINRNLEKAEKRSANKFG
jgi:rod shape-determining protein MreD